MHLSDAQNSTYSLLDESQAGRLILQASKILVLIYPIYYLLGQFDFMNDIMEFFVYFDKIFYFAFFVGLVACFAKNEAIFVSAAFLARTITALIYIIDLFDASNEYYTPDTFYYINGFVQLAVFGAITYFTFMHYQKSNYVQ